MVFRVVFCLVETLAAPAAALRAGFSVTVTVDQVGSWGNANFVRLPCELAHRSLSAQHSHVTQRQVASVACRVAFRVRHESQSAADRDRPGPGSSRCLGSTGLQQGPRLRSSRPRTRNSPLVARPALRPRSVTVTVRGFQVRLSRRQRPRRAGPQRGVAKPCRLGADAHSGRPGVQAAVGGNRFLGRRRRSVHCQCGSP
jgi:hypothetical protein